MAYRTSSGADGRGVGNLLKIKSQVSSSRARERENTNVKLKYKLKGRVQSYKDISGRAFPRVAEALADSHRPEPLASDEAPGGARGKLKTTVIR